MDPDVNIFLKRVRQIRGQHLPSSERIVAETFVRLGLTEEHIQAIAVRSDFNNLLRKVFEETLVTLENYERPIYSIHAIGELAKMRQVDLVRAREHMKLAGDDFSAFQQAVESLLKDWYFHFRQLFLSVSQSRKTRGGKDFELQIAELLRLAGFPFEPQHKQFRVDFMMPSYAHYGQDRTQCILLSAKRTLRERWQEVVDELHKMNCPNVFIATTDNVISAGKKEEIAKRNIKLVVFDEVKLKLFPKDNMVVDFTFLVNKVIPTWHQFW